MELLAYRLSQVAGRSSRRIEAFKTPILDGYSLLSQSIMPGLIVFRLLAYDDAARLLTSNPALFFAQGKRI
jgi:hypothetical protein